jgi:membrane-associated phospholipid phosphatase
MNTYWGKTVALWLCGGILLGCAFFLDNAVIAFVNAHTTPATLAFGQFGSHYGQWNWLMLPCAIAALVAWRRRDSILLRIVCVMVVCSILGGLGADVIRVATGRTRPSAPAPIEQGWYGPRSNGVWVAAKSDYNAFPSAHAAASMALIAPLLFLRRRAGWLLLPVPLLISAARVCVGAHHLSDVVAGMLLGLAIAQWVDWKVTPVLLLSR